MTLDEPTWWAESPFREPLLCPTLGQPASANALTFPFSAPEHRPRPPPSLELQAPPLPARPEEPTGASWWPTSMSRAGLRLRLELPQLWGSTPGIAPLLSLLLLLLPLQAGANCPCQDPALCQPIRNHPNFEVSASRVVPRPPTPVWSCKLEEKLEENL